MNEYEHALMGEQGIEVAVLGSSRLAEDDERWQQAYRLGELLAFLRPTLLTLLLVLACSRREFL